MRRAYKQLTIINVVISIRVIELISAEVKFTKVTSLFSNSSYNVYTHTVCSSLDSNIFITSGG